VGADCGFALEKSSVPVASTTLIELKQTKRERKKKKKKRQDNDGTRSWKEKKECVELRHLPFPHVFPILPRVVSRLFLLSIKNNNTFKRKKQTYT